MEGGPHYLLTYMVDIVDEADEAQGMARALIQQLRAIHKVGGTPSR